MTHKKTDEGYPIFRSYLETENDEPYYSVNTLSFYYEDMERKQKLIEDLAKAIAGYDQTLTGNLAAIEQQVAERFDQWDEKLKTFDGSVMDLLQEWVDDGTMDHIVDSSIVDQKLAPLTAQLAETDAEARRKKEPEDLADRTLELVTGGTVNILSKPQNYSVDARQTKFLTFGKNRFDKTAVQMNKFLSAGGGISDNVAYFVSDFIPVDAGQTYFLNNCRIYCLYDVTEAYLIGVSNDSSDPLTITPTVSGFIRFTGYKNNSKGNIDTTQFEVGTTATPFAPFEYTIPKFSLTAENIGRDIGSDNLEFESVGAEHIKENAISEKNVLFVNPKKNMYNPNDVDVLIGSIMTSVATSSSVAYNVSGFIPVKEGEKISFSHIRNYKFFDIYKNYIDGSYYQYSSNTQATVTVPADGFVRFSHLNATQDIQVEKGEATTTFEPFGYKLNENIEVGNVIQHDSENPLAGKRIVFFGDSITRASVYPTSGFPRLIGTKNNMIWHNAGVNGATVSLVPNEENRYIKANQIDVFNEEVDYIILQGGLNDYGYNAPLGEIKGQWDNTDFDVSTVAGATEDMIRSAIRRWNGKKIGFIITFKTSADPENIRPYYDIIRAVCEKWSVPYIDLWKSSGLTLQLADIANEYTTNGDRKHPNEKGYDVIAPKIEAWLKTL